MNERKEAPSMPPNQRQSQKPTTIFDTPPPLPLWKPELPQSRFTKQPAVVSQRAEARTLHEGFQRDRLQDQRWPAAFIAVSKEEAGTKIKKRKWWQGNGGDRDLWR